MKTHEVGTCIWLRMRGWVGGGGGDDLHTSEKHY